MAAIDEALSNARQLAHPDAPATPRLKLAILTCMDARIDPLQLFGLRPGDAHVLRNAGGRATDDAIRSLALSQAYLGTEEVMVVHHTDCGLCGLSPQEAETELTRRAGHPPPFPILAFADDREAVREDVAALLSSPFLEHREAIRGFIYDVVEGRVEEIT